MVTSLGGELIPEKERAALLKESVKGKEFRALVQVVEDELVMMRDKASDPAMLKEGTQPHYCGAVDGLNGALLRIAEMVAG